MPHTLTHGTERAANKAIGGVPTIHYFDFQSRGRGQVVRLFLIVRLCTWMRVLRLRLPAGGWCSIQGHPIHFRWMARTQTQRPCRWDEPNWQHTNYSDVWWKNSPKLCDSQALEQTIGGIWRQDRGWENWADTICGIVIDCWCSKQLLEDIC